MTETAAEAPTMVADAEPAYPAMGLAQAFVLPSYQWMIARIG